MSSPL